MSGRKTPAAIPSSAEPPTSSQKEIRFVSVKACYRAHSVKDIQQKSQFPFLLRSAVIKSILTTLAQFSRGLFQ